MCGGTYYGIVYHATDEGLSPRVRGNLEHRRRQSRTRGSIPACAGEPTPRKPLSTSKGVYPRVCGGTDLVDAVISKIPGLSPRVRGNHL